MSPLDQYQRAFCEGPAGDVRLLAPAGSGKTLSLLYRCLELARRSDGRGRFLVLTFTRAARDELRSRLNEPPFNTHASSIIVTTLNSWGWRRVRDRHSSPRLLGNENDRGLAAQHALRPIWSTYEGLAKAMQAKAMPTGKTLMNLLDRLKSMGFDHQRHATSTEYDTHVAHLVALGLERMLEETARDLHELNVIDRPDTGLLYEGFFLFWREASHALLTQATFTVEDQKYFAYLDLARQRDEAELPVGGARYTEVLVDEFQDINPLDIALIKALADVNRANLTLVGDDDQAIFEWRGATPSYILDPDQWFGRQFKTFILERNYRCPKNLVECSQALIANNRRRVPKQVTAMSTASAEIEIIHRTTFGECLDEVTAEIDRFAKSPAASAGKRIAIVSRKRAQLIPYQIILAGKETPFCAAEDLQVFLSQAFKDLMDMLAARADANTRRTSGKVIDDLIALCNRVKRYSLSKADAASLAAHLRVEKPSCLLAALDALETYKGPLKGDNADGATSRAFAGAIRPLLNAITVSEAIDAIGHNFAGMAKDYGKAQEDIFFTDPPFFYLAQYAQRYGDDLAGFIDALQAASDTLAQLPADEEAVGPNGLWSRPIHLMTALRAKGKEFDTVVLLDVNEGIWPHRQAEIEAERRVFYVAMTRAKRRLLITVSGHIGDSPAIASPFLHEAGLVGLL